MNYTADGESSPLTEQELRARLPNVSLPAQLLPEHVEPFGFTPYVEPPITLGDAQAAKRDAISDWRDNMEGDPAPIQYGGNLFDCDPASRGRIEAILLLGANPLGYWTDATNVDRTMDISDMRNLYGLIVQRGAFIHAHQRARKAALAALTSVEDVLAFDPAEGWVS